MIDNFWAYIDSLGKLEDDDLFLDINETMKKRAKENKDNMTKSYGESLR
jgi:hypothetical protein